MNYQNFFYISVSSAIILVAIFCAALIVVAIIIGIRIARFSKGLKKASDQINEILEKIKEKTILSSFVVLVSQGLKELVGFIKEKRKGKK